MFGRRMFHVLQQRDVGPRDSFDAAHADEWRKGWFDVETDGHTSEAVKEEVSELFVRLIRGESPTVVTLACSSRYFDDAVVFQEELKEQGVTVCLPSMLPGFVKTQGREKWGPLVRRFANLIRASDALIVFTPSGYVGPTVASEMGFAYALRVPIFSVGQVEDGSLAAMVSTAFDQGVDASVVVTYIARSIQGSEDAARVDPHAQQFAEVLSADAGVAFDANSPVVSGLRALFRLHGAAALEEGLVKLQRMMRVWERLVAANAVR